MNPVRIRLSYTSLLVYLLVRCIYKNRVRTAAVQEIRVAKLFIYSVSTGFGKFNTRMRVLWIVTDIFIH
jgi:hypothetical protein